MWRAAAISFAAIALAAALAAPAGAATFRGTAVDDPEMTVALRVSKAGVVFFDYAEVPVECSSGDKLREPGAEHSTTLRDNDRFSDRIEQPLDEGAEGTSSIRGYVGLRRAWGYVSYELAYPGGECHSGEIRWRAKRRFLVGGD